MYDAEDAALYRKRMRMEQAYKDYLDKHVYEVYLLAKRMDHDRLNNIVPFGRFPCWNVINQCWAGSEPKHRRQAFSDKQWNAVLNVMAYYMWRYDDLGLNSKLGIYDEDAIQRWAREGEF